MLKLRLILTFQATTDNEEVEPLQPETALMAASSDLKLCTDRIAMSLRAYRAQSSSPPDFMGSDWKSDTIERRGFKFVYHRFSYYRKGVGRRQSHQLVSSQLVNAYTHLVI